MSRFAQFMCYLSHLQISRLRELSKRTKVPAAEFVRQGVSMALKKFDPENETKAEEP